MLIANTMTATEDWTTKVNMQAGMKAIHRELPKRGKKSSNQGSVDSVRQSPNHPQANKHQGQAKQRCSHGVVSNRPVAEHNQACDAKGVKSGHVDTEGHEEHQGCNTDVGADDEGQSPLSGGQLSAEDANGDEGQGYCALGNTLANRP